MARSCFYQAVAASLYNAFSLIGEQNELIVISDDDEEPQPSTSGVDGGQNGDDDCIIIEDDDQPLMVVGGVSRPQNVDTQPSTSAEYVGGCEYDNPLFNCLRPLYQLNFISWKFINLLILYYFHFSCEETF